MPPAFRTLRAKAVDAVPFMHPLWTSLALGAVAANRIEPLKPRAEKLAFKIHRSARSGLARRLVEPIIVDIARSNRCKPTRTNQPPDFIRSRVMILKPHVSAQEPGVLKIMFSDMIERLPRIAGFAELSKRYRLVVEPSWTGAADPGLLQYASHPDPVVVLAGAESDFEFLTKLSSSLRPIRIGPCDWVDPRRAEPYLGQPKRFDLVVNSTWAAWKRHHVLFAALARLPAPIRVALIGVPWDGGTLDGVMACARDYGVADQLTVFERISFDRVMEVHTQSRAAALLSLKEGSNRALAEAMFCDVPVILLDQHWGGISKNVVPETGIITAEQNLPAAICEILDGRRTFSPRRWATEHISCVVSTGRLNTFLAGLAVERGEPWTRDILVHSNSPECTYWDPAESALLDDEYTAIERLFAPSC